MANLLDNLKLKLKNTLDEANSAVSDDKGWIRRGKVSLQPAMPAIKTVGSFLNRGMEANQAVGQKVVDNNFVRGAVNTTSYGLVDAKPVNKPDFLYRAGQAAGFFNPYNPANKAMAAIKIGGKATNLATKVAKGIGSEALQTGAYAVASKIGNRLGLNQQTDQFKPQNLATNLALGSTFRGALSPAFGAKVKGMFERDRIIDPETIKEIGKFAQSAERNFMARNMDPKQTAKYMVDSKTLKDIDVVFERFAGKPTKNMTYYDKVKYLEDVVDRQNIPNLMQMGIVGKGQSKNVIPSASGEVTKAKRATIKLKTTPAVQSSTLKLPGTLSTKIPSPQDTLLNTEIPQLQGSGKIKLKTSSIQKTQTPLNLSSDEIIQQAKSEIGSKPAEPKQSVGQWWDKVYTDWVDRYHPINKIASTAKDIPTNSNPVYTIKRFLGSSGIAESRFQTELRPIINKIDQLGIDKSDLDVYLKSRRDINLSNRGIKGSDSNIATQRINALEQRYGEKIKQIAQELYDYQSKGFSELAKDFLGKDVGDLVKNTNVDYVPFQRVMDEVDDFIGTGVKLQQGQQPVIKIKGSNKQIYSPLESIILNTYKQRAAIEKNDVAKSIVGLQDYLPNIGFRKVSKSGADTVSVWRDGKKEYWSVGQDIADAVKGMNEEQMNTFLKVLSSPARILRQGATGRNLDFMIPNVIRDQLDAAVGSKYGYIPFVDYVRGFAHLLRQDLAGGDQIYKQWMESGGAQSFGSISGRETAKEFLSGKTTRNPVKLLGEWITGGLDVMGRYSEIPTRLGLFQRALDKTGDTMKAAFESREGTLDFARMGAKMKVANSLIPFLNVGVQGLDKMARTFKANPAGFIAKMGVYGALPTITVSAYNHIYHPQEYAEIPQYEKDGNFVIINGRNGDGTINYFKIPKGNMIELISNPLESLISHAMGTNDQTIKQTLLSFVSQTLPIVGDGSSLKEIGIKTIGDNLPQAVKPVTENLLNRSFFKYNEKNKEASEIVPYYLKSKAPADQAYKFTEESYKVIGRTLNLSPLQVKNIMEGYLAGYVKMPLNVIESLNKAKNGEQIDKNKIPIIRRFFSQTYESNGKQITKETPKSERVKGAKAAENSIVGQEFTYTDSAGKNQKIIIEEIPKYKPSGQKELDKNQVSSYNSKIQTEIGNIRKLYQMGKIGAEDAEKLIKEYQSKKISTKKGKKVNPGKPAQPKPIQVKTPPKIQLSQISMPTPKVSLTTPQNKNKAKIKVKSLPKSKLKISKSYGKDSR